MVYKIYNDEIICERHRHKYEFNNEFRDRLAEEGLVISGLSPDERLSRDDRIKRPIHGLSEFNSIQSLSLDLQRPILYLGTL